MPGIIVWTMGDMLFTATLIVMASVLLAMCVIYMIGAAILISVFDFLKKCKMKGE